MSFREYTGGKFTNEDWGIYQETGKTPIGTNYGEFKYYTGYERYLQLGE